MIYRFGALAIGCVAMTLSTAALADNIDDAIKARQGFYQLVKHNAGALFGMAKGDIAYDAEQAAAHASNLDALAKMNSNTLWPAGSSKTDRPGKTRALAEIWTTYPAIGEKVQAFNAAAANLAGSAGGGLDALRADIGALGASCKGCHDNFRAKDF